MVIEGSREYKAAQELERALNDYSWIASSIIFTLLISECLANNQ